jgi:broad specificity phosphatase PhoE
LKKLIVLRHAQSGHHVTGLTGGWTDTPLTELGRSQAQLLAARCQTLFSDEPDLRLYSSDLLRATETAKFVSRAMDLPVHIDPSLREINNGDAVGMTWKAAKLIEHPQTVPIHDWLPYPGAETWSAFRNRVFAGLDRMAGEFDGTPVIVTHGGTGIPIVQWWLRLCGDCRSSIAFDLDPTSLTILGENDWGERTIKRLNDTGHLASLQPA